MKTFAILIGAGMLSLGGIAVAQAQPNPIQGTPSSVFPLAAPNEVQMFNGVPCRTVLVQGTRVPVQCAGPVPTGTFDPGVTGSIVVQPMTGAPLTGTPGSVFPYAAPNEVQIINGVPCRTVLIAGTNTRMPVECAR
jgi:hypothetical protein